jgi:glycyl-tRNA synthetase beta subunit
VLRIYAEGQVKGDLAPILDAAFDLVDAKAQVEAERVAADAKKRQRRTKKLPELAEARAKLDEYLRDRLQQYVRESIADAADLFPAVAATGWTDPRQLLVRVVALGGLRTKLAKLKATAQDAEYADRWEQFRKTVARTWNITKDESSLPAPNPADWSTPEEKGLGEVLLAEQKSLPAKYAAALEAEDPNALSAACEEYEEAFRPALEAFFTKVMVNVEDAKVRTARMALVRAVNDLFRNHVAHLGAV